MAVSQAKDTSGSNTGVWGVYTLSAALKRAKEFAAHPRE
tara:strand:- start:528 stop:644 length:117 start_codon:yes stop_codon:yes gene_type:complete